MRSRDGDSLVHCKKGKPKAADLDENIFLLDCWSSKNSPQYVHLFFNPLLSSYKILHFVTHRLKKKIILFENLWLNYNYPDVCWTFLRVPPHIVAESLCWLGFCGKFSILLRSITLSSKRLLVLGLWLKTQNQARLLGLVQRKTTTSRQWIFYLATGSPAAFSDHRQC